MLGNWIEATTTTAGTGDITLVAVTGFTQFSDEFFASSIPAVFEYCIVDGNNREEGLGYLSASNTLKRLAVRTTLVAGTYTNQTGAGTAITLSGGTATVYCDATKNSSPAAGIIGGTTSGQGVYPSNLLTATGVNPAMVANFLMFMPFMLPVSGFFSTLNFNCTTTNSSNIRIGVYSIYNDGMPYRLIASIAAFALSTGWQAKAFAANVYLRAGQWYYLAFLQDAAPAFAGTQSYEVIATPIGISNAGAPRTNAYVSFSYAALPDPYASGALTIDSNRALPICSFLKV